VTEAGDRIVIFGSFVTVGAMLSELQDSSGSTRE